MSKTFALIRKQTALIGKLVALVIFRAALIAVQGALIGKNLAQLVSQAALV